MQIQAGYFSKKEVTDDLVKKTKGRNWGKCWSSRGAVDLVSLRRETLTTQRTLSTKP